MRIEADRERCIGAGMCALIVSEVFDQDVDDGLVEVLDQAPPSQHHAAVRRAAQSCPSGALTIHAAD